VIKPPFPPFTFNTTVDAGKIDAALNQIIEMKEHVSSAA